MSAPTSPTIPGWVCPEHQRPLASADNLQCSEGCEYEVRNAIPRFVGAKSYADAFGVQWRTFRRTQLDSHTGLSLSADRARRCMGQALWNDLRGKTVLECGCGAGRFTEVLLNRGALVVSVDLSDAVEANQENCPQTTSHRIAQAHLSRLPFAAQQFDVVFCLGVIQHTPNPEESIARLYAQVRPGGSLVIDHYTYSLAYFTKTTALLRRIFLRLDSTQTLRWTERLVDLFLPLHIRTKDHPVLRRLVSRVSPVLTYYATIPDLSMDLQRELALLDTHDALTDYFKHFRSRRSIQRTLERLGAEEIWCRPGGIGIEARARRPMSR